PDDERDARATALLQHAHDQLHDDHLDALTREPRLPSNVVEGAPVRIRPSVRVRPREAGRHATLPGAGAPGVGQRPGTRRRAGPGLLAADSRGALESHLAAVAEASRCSRRIRRTSSRVAGLLCSECDDCTIFSDSTPSRCALRYATTPSFKRSTSPVPRTATIECATTPG